MLLLLEVRMMGAVGEGESGCCCCCRGCGILMWAEVTEGQRMCVVCEACQFSTAYLAVSSTKEPRSWRGTSPASCLCKRRRNSRSITMHLMQTPCAHLPRQRMDCILPIMGSRVGTRKGTVRWEERLITRCPCAL